MNSIDDVISRLDDIVERCAQERMRAGYFAALYRHMTVAVKTGIDSGLFEDGARMERLDICFAQRYFDAFDAYYSGRKTTQAWTVAFEATDSRWLAIVQQLLLGINAHINLDLGIVAAEISPGSELPGLQKDFNEINEIIASLVDVVMRDIGEVSPWFALLDRVAGKTDTKMAEFSIAVARNEAWRLAEQMAYATPDLRPRLIEARDSWVARFAGVVQWPGWLVGLATRLIALREVQDPRRVMVSLSDKLQPEQVFARRQERMVAAAAAGRVTAT